MAARARFSLAQLEYFVAVAETGSISEAAERLHASQSALSSAIHRLERELGCELFLRRHARGVTLTPSGRALLDRARALVWQAGELAEAGRTLGHDVAGELTAGCFVTLAPFYLPAILTRLRAREPELRVSVVESDGAGLHAALRAGSCEIALTYRLEIGADMAFDPLLDLLPYTLVSVRHPCAGRERVSLRELAVTPMVLLDLPEPRRFMLDMLARADAAPPEFLRTTNFETMRGLVAAGEGFTILNQRPRAEDSRVRRVEISDAVPVTLGLARPAGVRPNRRMLAFAAECRVVARSLAAYG